MLDSNNIEIRTGDFLKISGAYFKKSNGLYLVTAASDAPNYCGNSVHLHKIKKSGELCLDGTLSLPMGYYCSDRSKNRAAREHDAENLRYEVADGIPTYYAAEHFRKKATDYAERAENERRRWGDDRAEESEKFAAYYAAAAERLSATAEQPKEKEPEQGIKFYWNGIKVNGGRLIPCCYSIDENSVNIYAREYSGDLPTKYFAVVNRSDGMTDYFEEDHTTVTAEHPLYKFARYAALKGIATGHSYRKFTAEQEKEWDSMKNPGQPTAADLAAVEELQTAQESAKIAAEHAQQLEAREKTLRKIHEGRVFIEQTAEQHPMKSGEPTVEITFSENPAFCSWTESRDVTRTVVTINADGSRTEKTIVGTPRRRLILSVAAAEIILKHYDEQKKSEKAGYDKTDFTIRWAEDGEENEYRGRYDLGDGDGGLIEHIRSLGRWYRTHDEHTGKEIENPPDELSEQETLADWLEQFTDGGRIIKIEFAPHVIDFMAAKEKIEQEQREQAERETEEIFAMAEMLTDEQIEAAIYCIDPQDKENIDVARFFLQELARRDEKKSFEVFKKWKTGQGA